MNGLYGLNSLVDVKKLSKSFLFKPDNIFMKTLEATTKLGGFNQCLPIRNSNKQFLYSGNHLREDDDINTFFSLVPSHDVTTAVELIFGTKTLVTDVYAI